MTLQSTSTLSCPDDATHRCVNDITRIIVDENNLGVFYDQLSNSRCVAMTHSIVPKLMPTDETAEDETSEHYLTRTLPRMQVRTSMPRTRRPIAA